MLISFTCMQRMVSRETATDCTSKRAHKHLTSCFLSSFKKGFTHVLIRKTSPREQQLLVFYDYSFKVEKDVWNRLCRVHLFAVRYLSILLPLCVFMCVSARVVSTICVHPLADVQKLLKGDNFPLITLMRYSAAVLSVISPLLGRTTHTLHMLADCQPHRHLLITEEASYEEMKREMSSRGFGGGSKLSPLCNLCIFYRILPWQRSTFFAAPHCVPRCKTRLINKGGELCSQKLLKQLGVWDERGGGD